MDTCEKCGKVRDPEKYPLWIDYDMPPPNRKEEPDFAIAFDAADDQEKLMCPECIKEQGGCGFVFEVSDFNDRSDQTEEE